MTWARPRWQMTTATTTGGSATVGRVPRRRLFVALALVSLAYLIVQSTLWRLGIGWDETVYTSQLAKGMPAATFTAPRARGVAWLVAPVVMVTHSVTALRAYLSVVSSLALFGAFAVWLRLRRSLVVPAAAMLFASTWLAIFYGSEAMPNLWDALAGVAAVGFFLRGVARPDWRQLLGLAACLAAAALVRPTDSVYIGAPLVIAAVLVPGWRGRTGVRLIAAIAAGEIAGWADWVVEAYVRYGGLIHRLRAASAENATGLHVTLRQQAQAINGPILCRPASICGGVPLPGLIWWLAVPVATAVGLYAAARSGRVAVMLIPTLSAVTIAASYLFTVGYAAPRFLMPSYALLALPVAEGAAWLLRGRPRVAVVGLVGLGLAGHLAVQGRYFAAMSAHELRVRDGYTRAAAELRGQGIKPPCLVYGHDAVMIGYTLGCAQAAAVDKFGGWRPPATVRSALRRHESVAVVARMHHVPAAYLRSWRRQRLHVRSWRVGYVYLPVRPA